MNSTTEKVISPVINSNELTGRDAVKDFQRKVSDFANSNSATQQPSAIYSVSAIYKHAANIIASHPEQRADVLQAITASLPNLSYSQVSVAVEAESKLIEEQDSFYNLSLAPSVKAVFTLDDILPSTLASVIEQDCAQTGARDIATALMLMTSAASLVGSKVEIMSGVQRKPVPPNLYFFITGNSSKNKSIACEPIVTAMTALSEAKEREIAEKIDAINKSNDDALTKKEKIAKVQQNRQDFFWEVGSFSPEAVSKVLFRQEQRAGFLIHRDEASGLFHYKRWSGGAGAMSNAGDSSTDEFSNILITGWNQSLKVKSIRVADDKDRSARDQSLSISGCLQNKYLSEFLDFAIDNNGWTSRWVFVRANDGTTEKKKAPLDRVSPIAAFMQERLIPFLTSIRTVNLAGENSSTTLTFDPDAQEEYSQFHSRVDLEAERLHETNTEPAYATYLKKGQVRVLKFALLIHLFEALKGARKVEVAATPDHPFAEETFNWKENVCKGVTLETLQKAIKLEYWIRQEYQHISEDACSASYLAEHALEKQIELDKLRSVLTAVRNVGSIRENELKTKIRSRNLSSSEITKQLKELARRGCITRTPIGRTNELNYVKSIRD